MEDAVMALPRKKFDVEDVQSGWQSSNEDVRGHVVSSKARSTDVGSMFLASGRPEYSGGAANRVPNAGGYCRRERRHRTSRSRLLATFILRISRVVPKDPVIHPLVCPTLHLITCPPIHLPTRRPCPGPRPQPHPLLRHHRSPSRHPRFPCLLHP